MTSTPIQRLLQGLEIRRRKAGWIRKGVSTFLFIFFMLIIGAYWFITDSNRICRILQPILSEVIGGRVEIRRARVALFEGLRLEDVSVHVQEGQAPFFSARQLWVTISWSELFKGRIVFDEITAVRPRVVFIEDLDNEMWNFNHLKPAERSSKPKKDDRPLVLPRFVLRGGEMERWRMRDGALELVGQLAIDGQLTPHSGKKNAYELEIAARRIGAIDGPIIRGDLDAAAGSVDLSVENIEFSQDISMMLPSPMRETWDRHQLSGRMRITRLYYLMGSPQRREDFLVALEAQSVGATVWPDELMPRREYARSRKAHPGVRIDMPRNLSLVSTTESVARALPPKPIRFENIHGGLIFTPGGISLAGVGGEIERNRFAATSSVFGYNNNAMLDATLAFQTLKIPELPDYIGSMPGEARKVWSDFRPSGAGQLVLTAKRTISGGPIDLEVVFHIADGGFVFEGMPYPLRNIKGDIWYGKDKSTGLDRIEFRDLVCRGPAGTVNQDTRLSLSGWISPVDKGVGMELKLSSPDCVLDDLLRQSLPSDAKEVVEIFNRKEGDKIIPPTMRAGFDACITRNKGPKQRINVDLNLDVKSASGAFEGFPYPLENVTGRIEIHPFDAVFKSIKRPIGDGWISLDGTLSWKKNEPVSPDLIVRAQDAPIDENLLVALPEQEAQWMRKLRAKGLLALDGRIFLDYPTEKREPFVNYDLDFKLSDGSLKMGDLDNAITNISAISNITRGAMTIAQAKGMHGQSPITGDLKMLFPDYEPSTFELLMSAKDLKIDDKLASAMNETGRKMIDSLGAKGSADVDLSYGGVMDSADDDAPFNYSLVVRPRTLAIMPKVFPWELTDLKGEIRAEDGNLTLDKVSARHGETTAEISGSGSTEKGWDLIGDITKFPVNDKTLPILPAWAKEVFKSADFTGVLDVHAAQLKIRPNGDTVFDLGFGVTDGNMNAGLEIAAIKGKMNIAGEMVGDEVKTLSGAFSADSAILAGRNATAIKGNIAKKQNEPSYRLDNIRAKVALGDLAAQVLLLVRPNKPTQYDVSAVLNDADIRQVTEDATGKIRGRLKASLDLRGVSGDPSSILGRGDIDLTGENLYDVPAMTGLLSVTNLSLPIKSPFTNASARYAVIGRRVAFENIELLSPEMTMSGSGQLDYGAKTMAFTLTTNNPKGLKFPGIGDFLDLLKNELVQIQVKGTIHEPKIQPRSMNTITTTIDEVLTPRKPEPKKQDRR